MQVAGYEPSGVGLEQAPLESPPMGISYSEDNGRVVRPSCVNVGLAPRRTVDVRTERAEMKGVLTKN